MYLGIKGEIGYQLSGNYFLKFLSLSKNNNATTLYELLKGEQLYSSLVRILY